MSKIDRMQNSNYEIIIFNGALVPFSYEYIITYYNIIRGNDISFKCYLWIMYDIQTDWIIRPCWKTSHVEQFIV